MPDADPTIDTYPLPYGRYQEVLAEVSDPNVRKLVLHIEAEMKGLKELVYVALADDHRRPAERQHGPRADVDREQQGNLDAHHGDTSPRTMKPATGRANGTIHSASR